MGSGSIYGLTKVGMQRRGRTCTAGGLLRVARQGRCGHPGPQGQSGTAMASCLHC